MNNPVIQNIQTELSKIEDKDLRELAIERFHEQNEKDSSIFKGIPTFEGPHLALIYGFHWSKTPEGKKFWDDKFNMLLEAHLKSVTS